MGFKKTRLSLLPILLTTSLTTLACSSLAITDKENNLYHGRTLELSESLPSWLTFYPVNTLFQKKTPEGKNGISYKAKYDILAITVEVFDDGNNHNVLQGQNNGGLSFSANMMDEVYLAPLDAADYAKAVPVTSLGEWALSNFSTVSEVKQSISDGKFWAPALKDFGGLKSPLHYAFYDKAGGSIVVEAKEGKLHVYDNPTRVMTNGPDFPWHLTNLNNYTQLTNIDRSSSVLGGIKVSQPDSGIATSMLPSSNTSVGRFIRGVYYTTYAQKAGGSKESMNTLSHIMNRFDRTKDITLDTTAEDGIASNSSSEYTVWTSLSDLHNGVMMVRGYKDYNYATYSFEAFKDSKEPVFKEINL